MAKIKEEEIIAKYEGATAIYALNRRKKLTAKEHVLDFAVAFFTPLGGVSDEIDYVKDMGKYYLVEKDGEKLLVRAYESEITEEVITDKAKRKKKNIFIYDGNQFAVSKDLLTGKSIFTFNW